MIADVTFYKLKGSLIMNEFPLRPSGGYFPTSSVVHTVEKCRCTKNLEQTIVVPYWDDYLDVNIAKIGDDYYWITEARETIRSSQQSVEYDLVFNAPTTLVKKGDSLDGEWVRTPSKETEYLNEPVMDSELVPTQSVRLPNMSDTVGSAYGLLWVEVTSTAAKLGTANPVQDKLTRYGMFCRYSPGSLYNNYWLFPDDTLSSDSVYPKLIDVITDPEKALGLTASTITDISVSERCPYDYIYYDLPGGTFSGFIQLKKSDGTALATNVQVTDGSRVYKFYNLTPYGEWATTDVPAASPWEEVVIAVDDDKLDAGSITLYTTDNQPALNIPRRFFTPSLTVPGTSELTLDCRAVDDFSGIVTQVSFPSFDKRIVTINEGKLPYVGSAWEEYKAYEQAFDRQAVQNANMLAIAGAVTGVATGAGQAAIAGSLGGPVGAAASIAGSGISAGVNAGLSIAGNIMNQQLQEKRVAAQPGTGYQMGYGTMYCYLSYTLGARVSIETPYAYTSTIYDNYHNEHGYKAEGVFALTLTEGFVQGELNDTSSTFKDDRLNTAFMTGFKYV